ncbi:hypothetical protein NQ318_008943, partial [Aromia moschata]
MSGICVYYHSVSCLPKKMFGLLPVCETSFPVLELLPVEMWCFILRYLDPRSLLTGVQTHKSWLPVCRGDPVLRTKLKLALEEEKKMTRDMILNPRLSVRISRDVQSGNFRPNVKKSIAKTSDYLPLAVKVADDLVNEKR